MSRRPRLSWWFGCVALALLLAQVASGATARTFQDPLGDVSCCTRDLTDVRVGNDDAGTITIDAHFDASKEGDDDDDLVLLVDSDRNVATRARLGGGRYGFEYEITAHVFPMGADDVHLLRWRNGRFVEQPPRGVHVVVTASQIKISFDRHLIGDTNGFAFALQLWEVTSLGGAYSDSAPDRGAWVVPVVIAARRLRPVLATIPVPPRAGRLFVSRLALRVGRTGQLLASGSIECGASVAGRWLQPVERGFVARRARCSWKIPTWAHGKRLRGSIVVAITPTTRVSRGFALDVH